MEDIIFPIHMTGLAVAAVGVLLADHQAFNWVRGKKETLDLAKLTKYHHTVLWGLATLIISGFFLFWPSRNYLLQNTTFLIKMFFVVVLVMNSFVIGRFMPIATTREYSSLSFTERLPLMISGAASGVSWLGAAIAALFLFD
ncbi:MAG: hypothetical protein WC835_02600 [Candidatus Paceibacterota bacterium]|jgi:hypothetical protein